jgi:hypothetical protein
VTAAIFGLVGVALGGLITASATYFMERRRGWTAARAAGMQLVAEIDHGLELLNVDEKRGLDELRKIAATSWPTLREALLFRAGMFPSGLDAPEWRELARQICWLEVAVAAGDVDTAKTHCDGASKILEPFLDDRPALMQSLLRQFRRLKGESRTRSEPAARR